LLAFLVFSLSVPSLAFIHQRFGSQEPYVGFTDWYRTPDLNEARTRAQIHLDLEATCSRQAAHPPATG